MNNYHEERMAFLKNSKKKTEREVAFIALSFVMSMIAATIRPASASSWILMCIMLLVLFLWVTESRRLSYMELCEIQDEATIAEARAAREERIRRRDG